MPLTGYFGLKYNVVISVIHFLVVKLSNRLLYFGKKGWLRAF